MSQVGTLAQTEDSFDGVISTLEIEAKFWMEPVTSKPDPEKSPDFDIFVRRQSDGEAIKVGGVRNAEKRVAGKPAQKYFKLWLTDPSHPDWMRNLAAFPSDQKGVYRIVN